MVHVVRNAIDHGIESVDDRKRAGKGRPHISLASTMRDEREIEITIEDDGHGIDWEAIRSKARQFGIPSESHRDLVAAMFADGLSTREIATETSGRGVGLSALYAAVMAFRGRIEISSTPGMGTRLQLRFPVARPTLTRVAPRIHERAS
jgi:two-component system chemotaxis sensor kinase CheA